MNDNLLKEYFDRMGIITGGELMARTGATRGLWLAPASRLVDEHEIFLCRLDHGKETILSKHLLFCLRTVYNEPQLTDAAQDVYFWLSDNENARVEAVAAGVGLPDAEFAEAFHELQHKMCVTPFSTLGQRPGTQPEDADELERNYIFSWVTSEYWLGKTYRPSRYNDLPYCLSEIKRMLEKTFTTRELNNLIYKNVLD